MRPDLVARARHDVDVSGHQDDGCIVCQETTLLECANERVMSEGVRGERRLVALLRERMPLGQEPCVGDDEIDATS